MVNSKAISNGQPFWLFLAFLAKNSLFEQLFVPQRCLAKNSPGLKIAKMLFSSLFWLKIAMKIARGLKIALFSVEVLFMSIQYFKHGKRQRMVQIIFRDQIFVTRHIDWYYNVRCSIQVRGTSKEVELSLQEWSVSSVPGMFAIMESNSLRHTYQK